MHQVAGATTGVASYNPCRSGERRRAPHGGAELGKFWAPVKCTIELRCNGEISAKVPCFLCGSLPWLHFERISFHFAQHHLSSKIRSWLSPESKDVGGSQTCGARAGAAEVGQTVAARESSSALGHRHGDERLLLEDDFTR